MVHDEDEIQGRELYEFCRHVPKIELHAHLNGCIREKTLFDLARDRGVKLSFSLDSPKSERNVEPRPESDAHWRRCRMYNNKPRSLLECFEIFAEIPKCVTDLCALRRITEEALEDFANENVAYVELRSGPKCLLFEHGTQGACTKHEYVGAIVEVMKDFERREIQRYESEKKNTIDGFYRLPLVPRLLLSIDRSGTLEQAEENINIAIEMTKGGNSYVVGVELGGNPTKNDFRHFEPVFQMARDAGLPICIHCGEVPCGDGPDVKDIALASSYEEAMAILHFKPERLGHALLLPNSIMEILAESPIPIECCPTSNVMTLDLAYHHGGSLIEGLRKHPQLERWLEMEYPISINTDDSGLFFTDPTKELFLVAKAHNVGEAVLARIINDSIEHIFDASLKPTIARRVHKRISDMKYTVYTEKKVPD